VWLNSIAGVLMRRAAKVDRNQREIVKALRRSGCEVLSLAAIGVGCPDLLCFRAGQLFMLEVKDGHKFASQQKLTKHQISFHRRWPVVVVNSIESALRAVGVLRAY
jgi:Holliday junction resolvase